MNLKISQIWLNQSTLDQNKPYFIKPNPKLNINKFDMAAPRAEQGVYVDADMVETVIAEGGGEAAPQAKDDQTGAGERRGDTGDAKKNIGG